MCLITNFINMKIIPYKLHKQGSINLKSLSEFIINNRLFDSNAIILNQIDFDELALEFRNHYGVGISVPFYIMNVWIIEDSYKRIPPDYLGLINISDANFI